MQSTDDLKKWRENQASITKFRNKAYYDSHRDEKRDRQMRNKYNISYEDYICMLQNQGYRCAVCEKPIGKGYIDHDHETGKVRGILCAACNSGIGKLGDSIDGLRRALIYLEKNKE